jgi:hypothetical protein
VEKQLGVGISKIQAMMEKAVAVAMKPAETAGVSLAKLYSKERYNCPQRT